MGRGQSQRKGLARPGLLARCQCLCWAFCNVSSHPYHSAWGLLPSSFLFQLFSVVLSALAKVTRCGSTLDPSPTPSGPHRGRTRGACGGELLGGARTGSHWRPSRHVWSIQPLPPSQLPLPAFHLRPGPLRPLPFHPHSTGLHATPISWCPCQGPRETQHSPPPRQPRRRAANTPVYEDGHAFHSREGLEFVTSGRSPGPHFHRLSVFPGPDAGR